MSEYEHKTIAMGFAVEVVPEERAVDVLHYLATGCLLGGRSLDGVTWKLASAEHLETAEKQSKALARAMRKCVSS